MATIIKLAPTDDDFVFIGGIDHHARLIGGVADDVLASAVEIGLLGENGGAIGLCGSLPNLVEGGRDALVAVGIGAIGIVEVLGAVVAFAVGRNAVLGAHLLCKASDEQCDKEQGWIYVSFHISKYCQIFGKCAVEWG